LEGNHNAAMVSINSYINLMHNKSEHKDSDLKSKTRNIGGMHQGLACSGNKMS
jgi:hypothetical protein